MEAINYPMISTLQKQIKQKLKEKGLTIASLEKQAGLKSSAVKNILHGSSKKPSVYTVKAIAEFLNSSIDDLLEEREITSQEKSFIWDKDLLVDTCTYIDALYKKQEYTPNFEECFFLIKEVYIYSLTKNHKKLDESFAEWALEKSLQK